MGDRAPQWGHPGAPGTGSAQGCQQVSLQPKGGAGLWAGMGSSPRSEEDDCPRAIHTDAQRAWPGHAALGEAPGPALRQTSACHRDFKCGDSTPTMCWHHAPIMPASPPHSPGGDSVRVSLHR